MARFIRLEGQRFGRLLVQRPAAYPKKRGEIHWHCLCDCGNEMVTSGVYLRNGDTRSCGCLRKEETSKRSKLINTKHGLRYKKEYQVWANLNDRCHNPNYKLYKNYGGRGISVCKRWRNSVENFVSDMGYRPTNKHQIERINNNKGYFKENCKWATTKEQSRNRRSNYYILWKGEEKIISDWARKLGINRTTLSQRIRRGWTIHEAFTRKVDKKSRD